MSKILGLLVGLAFFGVFVAFSNFAFAVPENSVSDVKPNFPESIKIGEKAIFSLKMSNLGDYRISDIEPIITIMPKSASKFVHVEINPQLSTLWDGFYQNVKGTIYVDKGIPVDRIFVSVSFMGKNPFGEQVSLSSDSTFNASIKIEKSQNEEILNDSISDHQNEKQGTDYVRYDFSNEEHFGLPVFIKKNPLPSDIAQSMQDWCADFSSSSKKDPRFWDAIPIRILLITSEFQTLKGKTDSFVVNSHAAEESCPPNVWIVGTFASENGDRHRFSLFHDGNFFRYQIGEIQCRQGLQLTHKTTNGNIVCVKPETKQKLIERGWAKPVTIENASGSKNTEKDTIAKLLAEYTIEYLPDKLVVTGGPAIRGDPRCGAAIDLNATTHWFIIDSISNPQKMTLFSENPNPCQVNTDSCFCDVQMEVAALTLDSLSYFSPEEEKKFANVLIDYLVKENINRTPKFMIGKFNINYTNLSAIGYCGELWGYNTIDFFSGAIVDDQVKNYGLESELPPICSISEDAKWWERK